MTKPLLALVAVAAIGVAAPAAAETYPPGVHDDQGKAPGPHRTLHVCGHGHGCIPTIQRAVNAARAGDTIVVDNGTYREGVIIRGRNKRHLKLLGNTEDPERVVLEGKGLRGASAQNGVLIDTADHVTVAGFTIQHYKANGVFAINVNGYDMNRLRTFLVGQYGLYAFNSFGGTMRNSVAAWNNDSGFYIGQTPPQKHPIRSLVTNVEAYGNTLGFSGTNMRYVTITKSRWYDNGLGIVPNALDSEKYAPAEDNVIVDNDIFWNNFNYFAGAPYKLKKSATGEVAYPVGTGVLLFGGRRNIVRNNRVFGNYLVGVGLVQQILLKQKNARDLIDNRVTGNTFGKGGTDLNGRDLYYDGNGRGNCFANNVGVTTLYPTDGSTFATCPFSGQNAFNQQAQADAVNWTVGDPTHEANWVRNPHAPIAGLGPLEHYADWTGPKPPEGRPAPSRRASGAIVRLGDNFFNPTTLAVKRGAIVTWRWPSETGNPHNVSLAKGPRGARHFTSPIASSDFSYRRKLTVAGTYRVICTIHANMKMTIAVR